MYQNVQHCYWVVGKNWMFEISRESNSICKAVKWAWDFENYYLKAMKCTKGYEAVQHCLKQLEPWKFAWGSPNILRVGIFGNLYFRRTKGTKMYNIVIKRLFIRRFFSRTTFGEKRWNKSQFFKFRSKWYSIFIEGSLILIYLEHDLR